MAAKVSHQGLRLSPAASQGSSSLTTAPSFSEEAMTEADVSTQGDAQVASNWLYDLVTNVTPEQACTRRRYRHNLGIYMIYK